MDKIRKIDATILAATVIILMLTVFSLFATLRSSQKVSGNVVLFSFKSGNVILIDSDLQFKEPRNITAKDNEVISLKKGVYYWKIEDAIPEDVVQLTADSDINLKLKKSTEGYDVVNSENTTLNVDIYKKGALVGNVILDTNNDNQVSEVVIIGGTNA